MPPSTSTTLSFSLRSTILRGDENDLCIDAPVDGDSVDRHLHAYIKVMRAQASGCSKTRRRSPYRSVSLSPGVMIDDRYQITELRGYGGMGAVWKAEDLQLRRVVALKTASMSSLSERERFVREARLCSRIRHRNIVEIFDVGTTEDDTPYYTMELIEGRDLASVLQEDRPSIPMGLLMLRQIASALARVHRAGVIHRDIKPGNVVVDESIYISSDGVLCKLVDFGLASDIEIHDEGQPDLDTAPFTRSGQFVGTPLYMSPEQIRGEPLDQRSDIYGFGCLAREVLVGAPPFDGEELHGLLKQHLEDLPEPMFTAANPDTRRHEPDLLAALESLIGRCLAKEPVDRPASMTEIKNELSAINGMRRRAR